MLNINVCPFRQKFTLKTLSFPIIGMSAPLIDAKVSNNDNNTEEFPPMTAAELNIQVRAPIQSHSRTLIESP